MEKGIWGAKSPPLKGDQGDKPLQFRGIVLPDILPRLHPPKPHYVVPIYCWGREEGALLEINTK